MLPTLHDGDCVTVAPVDAGLVSVGDVLFCRSRRGFVAHRVARISAGGDTRRFILRGDASLEDDRPIVGPDVLGRVVSAERDGRARGLGFPGGRLGRLVVTAALRARPLLAAAARAWLAPAGSSAV
jgi:hypothetical protein